MPMRIQQEESTMTVFLDGEIDHHAARELREEIDGTIERARPGELVLDFRGVTFMDSSGIGLVMGRYRVMQQMEGTVTVANASLHIRKVMRLAGLSRLAHIE